MTSKAFLPTKAAHSSIMELFFGKSQLLSKIEDLKLLTLHRHSYLGHCTDVVAMILAWKDSQLFH